MTIAILKLEPGQTIPRPMNRASSKAELVEMLAHYVTYRTYAQAKGAGRAARLAAADSETITADNHVAQAEARGIKLRNIDSDKPLLTIGAGYAGFVKFYAFTEE